LPDHLLPRDEASRILEAKVRDLEAELDRKAARIQALEAEKRVKEAQILELQGTNEALSLLLAEETESSALHAAQARALLNSTSWRVMGPLRRAVMLLKSLTNNR